MRTLNEIATELGTDKASFGHNYVERYETYFSPLKDADIKIFEIGVDKGYSIKLWKEYFTKAQIYSIDIIDKTEFIEDRVSVFVGSQNDVNFLQDVNNEHGPFDVIIDDGSHLNEDMYTSFVTLFPLLKPGGLYIVEDLHACYWPWVQKNGNTNFTNVVKQLLDHVNASGKSGLGCRANDHTDSVYTQQLMGGMDYWDDAVEYVHAYRSIVFIKKYEDR
jgi:demethylmacrocin O-methyltransferase